MAVTFALTGTVEEYEEIAIEFLREIFNLDYFECFISDESWLSDFAGCCGVPDGYDQEPESLQEFYAIAKVNMIRKIREKYGIETEPRDTLIKVFEQIRQLRTATRQ